MGLESIFSIIPTISTVVGGLLESLFSEEQNAPLRKYSIRLGDSLMDDIDFTAQKGVLTMRNRTKNDLCVAFPAQNGHDPETITVPSCNVLKLNDRFKACAQNDIDSFTITACDPSLSRNGLFAGENALTISAGGTIKIGDPQPKYIGVYTSAKITKTAITIIQHDGKGKGEVVNLSVQTVGGDSVYSTHNQPLDANNSLTLTLPMPLIEGEEVHVGVTISYATADHNAYLEKNSKRYGVRPMTQQEMNELNNAICVNPRD